MPSSEPPALPFDPRPEAVEAWLSGLPVGNSRECCRQLYAGLQALNAAGLDPLPHCRMLDLLRPMAELESGKLMSGFVGKPFPLDDRERNSAKLSAQFQLELARGYQTVAFGDSAELAGERSRLIHGAMAAYEQYALRLALMYEPVSSKVWASVNSLFQLAARAGLAGFAIDEAFKRIAAFRLVCPTRLVQQDVQRLYELLCEQGGLLGLYPEPAKDGVEADFAIDLESGGFPGTVAPSAALGDNRCFLYTDAFRRRLSLQMQPSTPERNRLSEEFAVRIMTRLGGFPAFSTEQNGRQATVVAGLAAIIATAGKAERLKSAGGEWAGFGDLELMPLTDYGGGSDRHTPVFGPGAMDSGAFWNPVEGEYSCKVMRADTPGFYLLETAATLRPGRLIALNTDNTLIQVGLVGMGRPRGGGRLHAFELLVNDVRPVRVLGSGVTVPLAGLLGRMGSEDRYCLVVPPSKWRNGSLLELDSGGRRNPWQIGRMLETAAEFSHFELFPQAPGGGKA